MNNITGKFFFIINLFRFHEWVLTKYLFNLSLMMAFLLFNNMHPETLIKPAILYLIYMLPIGAFGYFLNDISDVSYDKKTGKANLSDKIPGIYQVFLLVFLFVLGTLPALWIEDNRMVFLLLVLLQVLCLIIYTVPAVRFKAHVGGIFCDAMFSYVFPGLIGLQLVHQAGNVNVSWHLLLVGLWLFFTGSRSVLSHQINYLPTDKASGQVTFVQNTGIKPALLIRTILIVIELLLFVLLVVSLPANIQYGVLAGLVLCIGYEVFFLKNIYFRSFINYQNLSLLNAFYNYFIFSGLCFVFIWEGFWIFVIPLLVFNTERVYALSKSFYFNVIKWFCYKSKGLFRRIKKIR